MTLTSKYIVKHPVLIIAYIRESEFTVLLDSLDVCKYSKIYLAIDGAKNKDEKIIQSRMISKFNSMFSYCQNEVFTQTKNLGIRKNVSTAVSKF